MTRPAPPSGALTAGAVTAATGVSYRQLDYWVRAGILYPAQHSTGSGKFRYWTPDQLSTITALAAISNLLGSAGPSWLMRHIAATPGPPWQLTGGGVTITITINLDS